MPALMVPPVIVVVAPRAIIANLLQTIFGLDDAAARSRGIGRILLVVRVIVIIRVIVPDASDKDAPEVAAMGEVPPAVTGSAASNRRAGTEGAALKRRAAMEVATETGMPTISTISTVATTTATSAAATTSSSNFDRKSACHNIACSRGTRIDERQGFGAIAREGRQREERCSRKAQQSRRSSQ